ncbi:hypothetical protein [Pseudonocardia sp. D17]|uniref:hypothetical protein n=1 Tax=Pseudonocardia sp. D17 TaxID=882661 RepID=UPI002B387112|nr:hypothetical protein PSD17_55620 [Pseudonocardia sp. D17]
MSLSSNVADLATRVATEIKAKATQINGNAPDLSALTTTAKSNLVAAINEVNSAVAGSSGIDDGTTGTSTTWSSSKISSEVSTASTADRDRANHTGTQSADTITDGTTNKAYTAAEKTKLAGIASGATANATDAQLRDRSTHTGTQTASTISDFTTAVNALVSAGMNSLVDSAPGTLDTLNELAAALGDDPNFAATINTALGNRVRTDTAAQGLTTTQQGNARTNIAAAAAADVTALAAAVGDTDADFAATFVAGLS